MQHREFVARTISSETICVVSQKGNGRTNSWVQNRCEVEIPRVAILRSQDGGQVVQTGWLFREQQLSKNEIGLNSHQTSHLALTKWLAIYFASPGTLRRFP